MADLVVTVPRELWVEWIAEGDAVGEPESGEEWGFFLGPQRPPCGPGDRLYIVAHDRLRGYAPITRIAFFPEPCDQHVEYERWCERCVLHRKRLDYPDRPRCNDDLLAPGRWAVARRGDAVACTVGPKYSLEQRVGHARAYIRGFRGFRTRWWPRADEVEFEGWATEDLWLNRVAGRASISTKPKPKRAASKQSSLFDEPELGAVTKPASSTATSSRHTCHAHGCDRAVQPKIFMCRAHWYRLEKPIRDAVWREYRPGQERDKQPSARYLAVQQLAISQAAFEPDDAATLDISLQYLKRALSFQGMAIVDGAGDPLAGLLPDGCGHG